MHETEFFSIYLTRSALGYIAERAALGGGVNITPPPC